MRFCPGVSGRYALEEGSFEGKQEKPALLMSELSEKQDADAPAPPESRAARGRQQEAPARKVVQVPSAPPAASRALARRSDAQAFFAFERDLARVAPEAEPLELTLEPNGRVELYASELGGALRLRLPVPSGTPEGSLIEVRIAGPEGRRELRQRFRLQANQTQLVLSLAPGWITPGTHSIELRVTDARGEDAPRYRSTLAVR